MKKIHYLLAFLAVAIAFSACNPLDKTYKQLGSLPAPTAPATSFSLTLSAADYALILPKGSAAIKSLYFKSTDTAKIQIPSILASKYPTYGEKSSATVTFAITPTIVKLADSLNADVAYTLQTTPTNDYVYPAFNGAPANTFSDLSATAVINWLLYHYQTPVANQLSVLTYLYFESGKTASSGTLTTDAFLYLNGVWTKIYRISNAQYAATNNGLNNWYVAADVPNLPSYFNTLLKADPAVMLTAKVGDVKYVNYRYTTTYQRVLPLTFNGTDWVTTPTLVSLAFAKTNGVWVADNSVNYKLTAADYTQIKTMPTTVNIQTALDNVAQFGDFNITVPVSATTGWTDAQVNAAIILILAHDFPSAVANQKFVITYLAYNGSTITVVKTFVYNGSTFAVSQ
jgi:hypothetical protein